MRNSSQILRRLGKIAALAVVGLVVGCDKTAAPADGHGDGTATRAARYQGTGPIRAVCTTGMVADLVRHVGGDRVVVDQIMGAGVDPHLFKATPDIVRRLSGADAVFYSGLHLEGRMTELFERMADRKPTVAVTSTVPQERLLAFGNDAHDPHVWFDVALWSTTIDAVRNFLVEFDPPHRAEYEARAVAYRDELLSLDRACREKLQAIPSAARVLVTAHDAFHYFGRAYDVEVRAIQGVSTETEAGVKEINDLVAFIAMRKIKAVFVEASVSERNVAALVEGCRAAGHDVRIGGELFSDSMGEPGSEAGKYVGMVRHNVDLIFQSLR